MRIRFLLAASLLALSAGMAAADGALDVSAAQAAGERGAHDEAIKLYTQALGAGDLAADKRAAALRGRGGEYASKSLIADTYGRKDDAQRLGEQAIGDFNEALKLLPDDAALYSSRGQVHMMGGRNDAAIADFSESLKRASSVEVLLQRASAERAGGDVAKAVADYDSALAAQTKKGGAEEADIMNERGYTLFLGGRFDEAARDFAKALTLGMGERAADVLWLPYQTVWVHLARLRAGTDDSDELKANATRVDLKQWPGTAVAYFLGQTTLQELAAPSTHGSMASRTRECNVSFFAGEQMLAKGDKTEASQFLRRALDTCSVFNVNALIARQEISRLAK